MSNVGRDPQQGDAQKRAAIRTLLAQEPFYHARVRAQGYTGYRSKAAYWN